MLCLVYFFRVPLIFSDMGLLELCFFWQRGKFCLRILHILIAGIVKQETRSDQQCFAYYVIYLRLYRSESYIFCTNNMVLRRKYIKKNQNRTVPPAHAPPSPPPPPKQNYFPFFIYYELYAAKAELSLLRSWLQRLFLFNEVCECWKNCETLDCRFHRC